MIDRFGKRRVLRALTKRKFRNKRRAEERKTGQKNFGFNKGGKVEEGLLIMIEEKKSGGQARAKRRKRKAGPSPSPRQKPLSEWERKQQYRKKVQDMGGNVIFADEWDKIDPGLKKGIGLHKGGGISGKSTVGELKKKYGSLKKGIRLKGKGSSFIEEYKKRVYGRSKGGSMVQGPMKRARGSGAAIKGTRFQGTF